MEDDELEFRERAVERMQYLKDRIKWLHLDRTKEVYIPYYAGPNTFVFNVKQLKFTKLLGPDGKTLVEFTDEEGCITDMTKMH
jgi:hypothetical protein